MSRNARNLILASLVLFVTQYSFAELPEKVVSWVQVQTQNKSAEHSDKIYSDALHTFPDLGSDKHSELRSLINSKLVGKNDGNQCNTEQNTLEHEEKTAHFLTQFSGPEEAQRVETIRRKLDKVLFPSESDVKPVKSAGVYLIAKNPKDGRPYILLGRMKKDDPKKKDTHIFNGKYSGFSGKAEQGELPMDAAAREISEETGGIFGPKEHTLSMIAQESTQVVKNAGWANFPVATYIVKSDFADYHNAYASKKTDQSEIQQIDWVSLNSIWHAVDKHIVPGTDKTWRQYNSSSNLTALFKPLADKYTAEDLKMPENKLKLELQKNELKRHLPVMTDRGEEIEIADYVARTLLESEDSIKAFSTSH